MCGEVVFFVRMISRAVRPVTVIVLTPLFWVIESRQRKQEWQV